MKKPKRSQDGATRARILDAARALLRDRGAEGISMRELAEKANVSVGLAYHYFRGKEEIPLALYGEHIGRHEETALAALASRDGLAERIEAVLLTGLDVRLGDRAILRAMASRVLDLDSPVSLFAQGTAAAELRDRSIQLFRTTVDCEDVHEDLREPLAIALWAAHLGVLLHFVLENEPGQKKTRKLIEDGALLMRDTVLLLGSPLMEPMRARMTQMLRDAGLLAKSDAPPP